MRTIKYRGKRVDNGKWVEGDLIHGVNHKAGKIFILPIIGGIQSLSSGIDPIDGWEVDPETVGQFTGLLDKNGKDIFEGDIIKLHEYGQVEVPVIYRGGSFCVKGFNWDNSRCEVIGNIHDNLNTLSDAT